MIDSTSPLCPRGPTRGTLVRSDEVALVRPGDSGSRADPVVARSPLGRSDNGCRETAATEQKGPAMRKRLTARGWSLVGALALATAIAVPMAIGSSHREAPNIILDPSADNTDVYACTAHDAPGAITIASNWIPGQVPANGPNFFRFDDRARYYNNIDNNGDGVEDISLPVHVRHRGSQPELVPVRGPGDAELDDPGLNVIQTLRPGPRGLQEGRGQVERRRSPTTSRSRRRTSGRRRSRTTGTSSPRRPGR